MDPVFFLHIPKTAGTSLRLWLKQAMPEAGSSDLFYPHQMAGLSNDELARRMFHAGHFTINELKRVLMLHPDTKSVTVLRDPAGIVESIYLALARLTNDEISNSAFAEAESTAIERFRRAANFADFMKDPERGLLLTDFQTRHFLLDGDIREGWELPPPRCERASDVADAMERLRSLSSFGLSSDMVRSCVLFCDALGWPWLGPLSEHNRRPQDAIPDARLEPIAGGDGAFYALAVDLFEQRWADLCARMGADPAAPDQGLAGVIAGLDARALEILSTDRMGWTGVEDGLFARGLGERFFYEPEGRWLRNVTGGMTVFAPCPADARRLSLCFGYILPDPEKAVLTLNGMATPFVTRYEQEPGGAWRIWLEADLPDDRKNAVAATVSGATDVQMRGSFLGFAIT